MSDLRLSMASIKEAAMIGAALAVVWMLLDPKSAGKAAGKLAGAMVGAVDGVVSGTVKGIGSAVGLPDPADRATQLNCCAAINGGNVYDVSVNCPAKELPGVFLNWMGVGKTPSFCPSAGGATGTW